MSWFKLGPQKIDIDLAGGPTPWGCRNAGVGQPRLPSGRRYRDCHGTGDLSFAASMWGPSRGLDSSPKQVSQ